jgi:hypothetical protein
MIDLTQEQEQQEQKALRQSILLLKICLGVCYVHLFVLLIRIIVDFKAV